MTGQLMQVPMVEFSNAPFLTSFHRFPSIFLDLPDPEADHIIHVHVSS
jgi:hypothetical protein